MAPVGSTRRQARERALGLLYEAASKGRPARAVVEDQPVEPDPFAVDIATGVEDHQDDIDELIRRFARGWTLERMPVIDRLLLRMGSYELLKRPDVPTAAVISEAVELAKRFSTDDSSRFVNGVLARIADEVRDTTRPHPGRWDSGGRDHPEDDHGEPGDREPGQREPSGGKPGDHEPGDHEPGDQGHA